MHQSVINILYIGINQQILGRNQNLYFVVAEQRHSFQVESGPQISAKDILEIVYKALSEKGYNPVNQIVGYIMSGDPTYITSHNGARSLIMKMERDELVEEMLKTYIEHNEWE